MKKIYAGAAVVGLLFLGCGDKPEENVQKPTVIPKSAQESGTAAAPAAEDIYGVAAEKNSVEQVAQNPHQQQPGIKEGTVVESMDAGVYTYAKINDGNAEYWIAGPKTEIKTGERVSFAPQMWMENFPSKTLNRTFDKILFVAVIAPLKGEAAHNCESCDDKKAISSEPESVQTRNVSQEAPIPKADGGYTVAEIYQKSGELKDKIVSVNGRVTKVVRGVMGKDWVHIQDGSGTEGKNDLVVTSPSADVQEGETVTVTGKVKTDVDFGYGYFYPVLMEEASFKRAG